MRPVRQHLPQDAITLAPQLNLTGAALEQRVLHEEEPFPCVECGTLFGVKSTIDRITDKLRNHSMFADESKLRMIQMCDDCRINAQYHSANNPLAGAERPRPAQPTITLASGAITDPPEYKEPPQ